MSETTTEGVHHDVPEEVYHRRVLGLASKSALDLVNRSPAHYKAWVDGKLDTEETPAMRFGTAFHCAVLEPEKFARRYVTTAPPEDLEEPDFGDCRYRAGKEARAAWRLEHAAELAAIKAEREAWQAANAGKESLSAKDMAALREMAKAVHAHPLASRLVTGGRAEVTIQWQDEETGLPCKGRVDYVAREGKTFVDLKSTANADHDEFRRSCATYGYHRQAAFYQSGARALGMPTENFLFIAVEKTAPYQVAVYSLSAESTDKGLHSIRDDLATMAECMKSGVWPGYPLRIQELTLPPWAA